MDCEDNIYGIILKSIEDELNKCYLSLKSIREQISPLIKDITDTEEEYGLLVDRISHFYRDFRNEKTEKMYVEGYTGNIYTEYEKGTEDSVPYPIEARREARENGMLLSIHNHPTSTSYQSDGDMNTMNLANEKYMITVSSDGLMITKNTSGERFDSKTAIKVINRIEDNLLSMVDKTDEIKELDKQILSISEEDYSKKYKQVENKLFIENNDEIIGNLNSQFKENDLPLVSYYTFIEQ